MSVSEKSSLEDLLSQLGTKVNQLPTSIPGGAASTGIHLKDPVQTACTILREVIWTVMAMDKKMATMQAKINVLERREVGIDDATVQQRVKAAVDAVKGEKNKEIADSWVGKIDKSS
eukprot:GDKI01021714.1.p1 GENE.GDKI01021714.1~~GDKI01021714.1.p1  ORF type:complete len:117 (+),score=21.22 GDKI01021714.1:248-598(+)